MTDKQLQRKAVIGALKKAYAPEHCPKNRNKGKCQKCERVLKCDKDFEFKLSTLRLQSIAQSGMELKKKLEKKGEAMTKTPEIKDAEAESFAGGPEAAGAAPEAPAEAATPEKDGTLKQAPEAPAEAPAAASEAPAEAPAAAPGEAGIETFETREPEPRVVSPMKFWR